MLTFPALIASASDISSLTLSADTSTLNAFSFAVCKLFSYVAVLPVMLSNAAFRPPLVTLFIALFKSF